MSRHVYNPATSYRPDLAAQAARETNPRLLPRERPCLRCRKPFARTWCGNRVCDACASLNAHSVELAL